MSRAQTTLFDGDRITLKDALELTYLQPKDRV